MLASFLFIRSSLVWVVLICLSVTTFYRKVVTGIFQYGINHARVSVSVHHPRYKALRAALVALRNAAQLTQMQLAQRLEVGQSFVSKIERGDAYVDVMLFVDWCIACGVNPAQALEQIVRETPDSAGLQRR